MPKSYNLAILPNEERRKLDVDLHASGIVYKERYGMHINYMEIEAMVPDNLKEYFKERVTFYRKNPFKLIKIEYQ